MVHDMVSSSSFSYHADLIPALYICCVKIASQHVVHNRQMLYKYMIFIENRWPQAYDSLGGVALTCRGHV